MQNDGPVLRSRDPVPAALRLAASLNSEVWPLDPGALAALQADVLHALATGTPPAPNAAAAQVGFARAGSVAIIPVHGVIRHRPGLLEQLFGIGASGQRLEARLRLAAADPDVSAIVLDVDSPGGSVGGLPELADMLFGLRGDKPIVAVANTVAASAAYWLAAQADEIVASPSAVVGSVGVWMAHVDISGFEEMLGIKTTLISAGEYKVEGNPFEPLSDEARAELQRHADASHAEFVAALARGRGVAAKTVREDFGKGRLLRAKDALAAGMVDRVGTLAETVQRLQAGRRSVVRRGPPAGRRRMAFA